MIRLTNGFVPSGTSLCTYLRIFWLSDYFNGYSGDLRAVVLRHAYVGQLLAKGTGCPVEESY